MRKASTALLTSAWILMSALSACSDDGTVGPDAGDGSMADAMMDTSPDGSMDASPDAEPDAGGDATADADADSGMPSDAAPTDAGPDALDSAVEGWCRGERCFVGQECTASGCAFPCMGTMVPGDYATVAEAVSALEAAGGRATICVAPGSYPTVRVPGGLTIVGPSRETVMFDGITAFGRGTASARGMTVSAAGASSRGGNLFIEACRITNGVDVAASTSIGTETASVTIHGCDVTAMPGAPALRGRPSSRASAFVAAESSYIHDASIGAAGNVSLRNCTLVNNRTAVETSSNLVVNNSISGSDVAFSFVTALPPQYSNNAIFDNVLNYSGFAVAGPGEVRDDPLFSAVAPPVPGPGSPLIGAALAVEAAESDYWGVMRVDPDIGAVEAD